MNEIDQAFNEYSKGSTITKPENFIAFYVDQINMLYGGTKYDRNVVCKGVNEILTICRSHTQGEIWIMNSPAKIIAIACVYFYMNDMNREQIDNKIFSNIANLSWACIKSYYDNIVNYYNFIAVEQVNTDFFLNF